MSAKELPTPEEMQEMAEVDLKNIDTSNLIDIEQVKIRTELPQEERIADYIHQILSALLPEHSLNHIHSSFNNCPLCFYIISFIL